MTLRIPANADGRLPDFAMILDGILDTDQFDDWLPDPILFQDIRAARQSFGRTLGEIWGSGEVEDSGVVALNLPRAGGGDLPAMALPLKLRCVAHGLIAGFAPGLQGQLISDKVRGFRFQLPDTNALFTPPGYELPELAGMVINAALIEQADTIHIIDVESFSKTAAAQQLISTLTSLGVPNAQALFLQRVLQVGPAGLPSIDDAFAFVYNFYLRPVDDELARRGINFFRYRDEYFVLSASDADALKLALAAHGMRGAETEIRSNQSDIKAELGEQWSTAFDKDEPDGPGAVTQELGRLGDGRIIAVYDCDTLAEEMASCQTDTFEIEFVIDEGAAIARTFDEAKAGAVLDCIALVPVLRRFNQARGGGVPFVPPFDATPAEHRSFARLLSESGEALSNALAVGLDSNRAPWQAYWAAGLLAEAGTLDDSSANRMKAALGGALMPEFDWQMRVSLSRSAESDPSEIWKPAAAGSSPFAMRASALAAYYFAKRGKTGPWSHLASDTSFGDRGVIEWLRGNL